MRALRAVVTVVGERRAGIVVAAALTRALEERDLDRLYGAHAQHEHADGDDEPDTHPSTLPARLTGCHDA